ncbi:hypothetical protein Misp06_02913 [Microbulbifer sp. NBRC 101763]
MQIGLVPNTEFLKETDVEMNRMGEIVINERGATSVPGVYAAGDARAQVPQEHWARLIT